MFILSMRFIFKSAMAQLAYPSLCSCSKSIIIRIQKTANTISVYHKKIAVRAKYVREKALNPAL